MSSRTSTTRLAAAAAAALALAASTTASADDGAAGGRDRDRGRHDASASAGAAVASILRPGPAPALAETRRRRRERSQRLRERELIKLRGGGGGGDDENGRGRRELQDTPLVYTCTGAPAIFVDETTPSPGIPEGRCVANGTDAWEQFKWASYPENFLAESDRSTVFSDHRMYVCPVSKVRIQLSNGIPAHDVYPMAEFFPCELFRLTTMALDPPPPTAPLSDAIEPGSLGTVAIALDGVPIFGAQEAGVGNALDPTGEIPDARFWYGHASTAGSHHYHNPQVGLGAATSEQLLGYAMDGYPLYGPMDDPDDPDTGLDACNGRLVDGEYRYHVRTIDQVDETSDYCDANKSSAVKWNYIVGCFRGPVENTTVIGWNATTFDPAVDLPDDCVLESEGDATENGVPIDDDDDKPEPPKPPPPRKRRPNIIIMQPDDMLFYPDWNPPTLMPGDTLGTNGILKSFPASGLPNIERLRTQGLTMTQAHAASPSCGTSRYSTLTGRYASRSGYGRLKDYNRLNRDAAIPVTKLMDIVNASAPASANESTFSFPDAKDCTEDNLAVALKSAGYRTGMIGKWHLTRFGSNEHDAAEEYSYSKIVDEVKECGFDFAGGVYAENLFDTFTVNGTFGHNMEWVTSEGVRFIKGEYETTADADDEDEEEVDPDAPFLMYFNPTAPHTAGSVIDAMDTISCRITADLDNPLTADPLVRGMTTQFEYDFFDTEGEPRTKVVQDGSCAEYRNSVKERSGAATPDSTETSRSNDDLGSIWVDDSVGALFRALEDEGKLDDTVFIFQMDHGMIGKKSLYEGGNRIVQFVHYPAEFGTDGRTFDGLVSTIDVAPTVLDYAGIRPSKTYAMDGKSWRPAIGKPSRERKWRDERCLFFEADLDRSVKCGRCDKLLEVRGAAQGGDTSATNELGVAKGLAADRFNYFNLCGGSDDATTPMAYPDSNPEVNNSIFDLDANERAVYVLRDALECHKARTSPKDGLVPDYLAECDATFGTLLQSDEAVCGDVDQYLVEIDDGTNNETVIRTCEWLSSAPGIRSGGCAVYGEYCKEACGLCPVTNTSIAATENGTDVGGRKAGKHDKGDRPGRRDKGDRPGKADKVGKTGRPERGDRPGKLERGNRPDKGGRPGKAEKGARPGKGEKTARPAKGDKTSDAEADEVISYKKEEIDVLNLYAEVKKEDPKEKEFLLEKASELREEVLALESEGGGHSREPSRGSAVAPSTTGNKGDHDSRGRGKKEKKNGLR